MLVRLPVDWQALWARQPRIAPIGNPCETGLSNGRFNAVPQVRRCEHCLSAGFKTPRCTSRAAAPSVKWTAKVELFPELDCVACC